MTTVSSRAALGSRVLAQRNQAAVAVGAWVESGTELWKHPSAQASLTEELVEERRCRSEQNLRLFQENVRQRVARQELLRRCEPQGRGPELSPEQPQCDGGDSRVLWPMDRSEELRRQRQSQILMQRRLFLSKDRQNMKENEEQKKHLLKTASLKEEKEHERLVEETRLREARALSMAQESLEQRERQVQQTLRQEATEGAERRHRRVPKTTRLMDALRVQLRELFPGPGLELPPLCCCGSFWESHPDTCANNCVFHNNPKAYVQALQTVVHCWDLL
ncbi:coiled-coil domain-containing protein 15 [Eucyclogobius newberryi]|uniref:coiled-coil domain-containing protein 15 n=1 Tax=Eucyclogobius newberryi TaxID=166745 RepID=UPI003B5CB6B1